MKILVLTFCALFFGNGLIGSSYAGQDSKKILYIDSYFPNYSWSYDITAAIESVLAERTDIELKIFRMDTKRNQSETYKQQAALRAKKLIDSWKPDLVIASDDNASKYLIAPWFKDSELPIVFCGLNWDASVYGFPTSNITGMVEVSLAKNLIQTLRAFAKGDRVGFLASDTISERKEMENISQRLGLTFKSRFVRTFAELKQSFLELQKETDIVLILECRSVQDFDHAEMVDFVREKTSVPTGTTLKFMNNYVLITYAKLAGEQGEYAAETALEILSGKSPGLIPVAYNKRAKIYLNMKIARALNIKFPLDLLEDAHLISARRPRVLYVNSYHKGYKWSDDIEKGLLKALHITAAPDGSFDTSKSTLDFKIFRMDTKLNKSRNFIEQAVSSAKNIIDAWHPDIVVVSDDNAAKFLIAPLYKHADFPVVFCGLNWDASIYGFPTQTVTGMVEIDPVQETIEMLKKYAKGARLGYIGSDNLSNRKALNSYIKKLGIQFTRGALVSSFDQWKKEYLRLQDSVDMLLWLTPTDSTGWDRGLAHTFILDNTKIPTGSMADHQVEYTLLGNVKIAEEQGWWAGKVVLRILDGISPASISVTTNKQSKLYLNMLLAKRLGIKFSYELLEEATLLDALPE